MRTSKRHQESIAREEGCRTARRAVEAARRRSALTAPALRRISPLG